MAGAGYESSALDMSKFGLFAAPRADVTLPQLETEADAVIAEVIAHGVSAKELERAKSRLIADIGVLRKARRDRKHQSGGGNHHPDRVTKFRHRALHVGVQPNHAHDLPKCGRFGDKIMRQILI